MNIFTINITLLVVILFSKHSLGDQPKIEKAPASKVVDQQQKTIKQTKGNLDYQVFQACNKFLFQQTLVGAPEIIKLIKGSRLENEVNGLNGLVAKLQQNNSLALIRQIRDLIKPRFQITYGLMMSDEPFIKRIKASGNNSNLQIYAACGVSELVLAHDGAPNVKNKLNECKVSAKSPFNEVVTKLTEKKISGQDFVTEIKNLVKGPLEQAVLEYLTETTGKDAALLYAEDYRSLSPSKN